MTDNEIIKALECCEGDDGISYCNKCSLYEYDNCVHYISQKAREVINRQKAEIDELQHEILSCNTKIQVLQEVKEQLEKDVFNAQMNCDSIDYEYELLKQEKSVVQFKAIKEFAEKLKERNSKYICDLEIVEVYDEIVDNLVKEMTG